MSDAPKRRTFKKFTFRGIDLEQLLDMNKNELVDLFCARPRRKFSRGLKRKAHALIKKMTAEAYPYDFDPWMRPGPTTRAYLQLGFALARANARMLLHADSSRRSSQNRVRTSRLRSPIGS